MELLKDFSPILSLLVILGLPIFIFLTKAYLQSYISENAKSNIQKRDIEELTQKVEGIKAIYSKENELIKYQLNQLLSLKEKHRNEERNSLMKFHAAYIHWIYLLQGVNLADYNSTNLDELLEKKLSLNNFFYSIHVERANVLLIVNNEPIILKTYDLIQKLIAYKSFIERELLALQHLLTENNSLLASFLKVDKDYDKNKLLLQKIANDDTQNRKEIEKLKSDFNEKRTEEFLKCRYVCDDFAKITKEYLVSIDV